MPTGWNANRPTTFTGTIRPNCIEALTLNRVQRPFAIVSYSQQYSDDTFAEALVHAPSAGAAKADFGRETSSMADCDKGFTITDNNGKTFRGSVSSLSLPGVGQHSAGFEVVIDHDDYFDVLAFRQGSIVGATFELSQDGQSTNTQEQAQLDSLAIAKIDRMTHATLPSGPEIVPNVVGQSQAAAVGALETALLEPGAISYAACGQVFGDVCSQSLASGTADPNDTPVNLTVSSTPSSP